MGVRQRIARDLVVAAEPGRVWNAVVTPELLSTWLDAHVDVDLRAGGRGTVHAADGPRHAVVEDMEPGRRLVFHWWPTPDADAADAAPATASTVEIVLSAARAGTRVTVTETALPDSPWAGRLRALVEAGAHGR